MNFRFITLFMALLAVTAQLAVVAALVLALGRRWSPGIGRAAAAARNAVAPQALVLAAAVALVSAAGSLYLSEVANFVPCKLCWYQRIAMYPLVPILAVAAWRRDPQVFRYVLPLTAVGGAISVYHMTLERFPELESVAACDVNNPCSVILLERFGYLTIPTMALSGFALITVLALAARSSRTPRR